MNNRFFLIAILIYLSVQVLGQDVVPRQAPIDNMSSFEDSINKDKGDNSEFTKIPIIIDSTEGWEWIDNEKAEDVFETYPLRMDYKKYSSHPQYRVVDKYYDLNEPNLINVVYNSDGKLVRVINICLPQKLVCYSLGYWTSIKIKYVNNSNQLPFFIINFFTNYTILWM